MKRLLLELGVLILSITIIMAVLDWHYRDYVTPVDILFLNIDRADKGTQTLLIGNSHLGVLSHDFYLDSTAVNVSIGGQDVFHQMQILKYGIAKLPKIKTVIINIDYEVMGSNIVKCNEAYIDREYFPYTPEIYDNSAPNRFVSSLGFFRANRDLRYIFDHARMRREATAVSKAQNFVPNEIITPELCKKRAMELSITKFNKELVNENLTYLQDIIKIAQAAHINLILASTPRRPCYKSFMNAGNVGYAKAKVDSFMKAQPVPFHDYFSDGDFSDDDFRDPDHMSEAGVRKFTQKLAPYFVPADSLRVRSSSL